MNKNNNMNDYTAGDYADRSCYTSYQPAPIVRQWAVNDMEVLYLLEEASKDLARLDMYIEQNSGEIFQNFFVAEDAVHSVRIAGYDIGLKEYIEQKDNLKKYVNAKEVFNYITALENALKKLSSMPFSARLIRDIHRHLQLGSQGHDKMPGDYRTSQTWVGGATMQEANYIPPVPSSIVELMSDFELFANDESQHLPVLLKAAILHYQFEAIHPFLDANGRVGRLIVPLYLVHSGMMKYPILSISRYFEENRLPYIESQEKVREDNDMEHWIKFFLKGVSESARYTLKNLTDIVDITNIKKERIKTLGIRASDGLKVLDYANRNWVLSVVEVEGLIGKSNVTAYKLLDDLERMNALKEISGQMRNRVYLPMAILSKVK